MYVAHRYHAVATELNSHPSHVYTQSNNVTVNKMCLAVVYFFTFHLFYFFSQGDIVQLKCFYGTEGLNTVTFVSTI